MKREILLGSYKGHLATPSLVDGICRCCHTGTATDCLVLEHAVFRPTDQNKHEIKR